MVTESASVEGISLRVKSLHLPPRSNKTQRVWYIGEGQLRTTDTDPRKLKLDVIPQNHKSFSSLKAVLKQLKPLAQPHQLPDLAKIENYLHEACPGEGGDGTNTHGQLLADSVAYAIMRRISRESFYTGRLIELAAKTINAILCSLPDCREVHVNHLDQLDRPSFKLTGLRREAFTFSRGCDYSDRSSGFFRRLSSFSLKLRLRPLSCLKLSWRRRSTLQPRS